MPLLIGGQPVTRQRQEGAAVPAKDLFAELCTEFELDPLVGVYLAETAKPHSLQDLVYSFSSEAEVGEEVRKIPQLPDVGYQSARLRQAWHACRDTKSGE